MSTSSSANILSSVSKFISVFACRMLSGSVLTTCLAYTSPIVSPSVLAFSSGGVSASKFFNASPFTLPSVLQLSARVSVNVSSSALA